MDTHETNNFTRIHVNDLIKSMQNFGFLDYTVFLGMLIVCSGIGLYFALSGGKRKSKKLEEKRGPAELEYLIGGRSMQVFPVAISLVATWISGITLLGTSTEMYVYGTEYVVILIGIFLNAIIVHYIFLPVYAGMRITSIYQYLEERFDRNVRTLGSVLFFVGTFIWLPIVIYVPALAFNQVTGVNIHIITPIVCLICVFYTSIGGIKAVVWTDVIQTIIMVCTMIFVAIKGTLDIGGINVIHERSRDGDRYDLPSFSLDPNIRHSMHSVILGGGVFWLQACTVTQTIVQRYLSLPDLKATRQALWIFISVAIFIICLGFYNGLLIYATYHDCDPLSTKLAKAKDQLMPLFVMDVFKNLPGMPGLFVAGIFSAALSSLSSALNSLTAIALEDFIKPRIQLTEWQTNVFMRCFVVICGIVCVCLVFIVEKLGPVLQIVMSIAGTTQGPLLGMFVLGVMSPWINGKSVLTGGISAILCVSALMLKQQTDIISGTLQFAMKPVSTEGCWYEFDKENATVIETEPQSRSIFHISYLYITVLGVVLTILISHISMIFYGRQDLKDLDLSLLAPFVRNRMRVTGKACEKEMQEKEMKVLRSFDEEEEVPAYTEHEEKQPLKE